MKMKKQIYKRSPESEFERYIFTTFTGNEEIRYQINVLGIEEKSQQMLYFNKKQDLILVHIHDTLGDC